MASELLNIRSFSASSPAISRLISSKIDCDCAFLELELMTPSADATTECISSGRDYGECRVTITVELQ